MIITGYGSFNSKGQTIVYDENGDMQEVCIARYKAGTEIEQDSNGNWRAVLDNIEDDDKENILEIENFYYATRDFLPYKEYLYVIEKFPTTAMTRYEKDPFYLTDVFREGASRPVATFPEIDKHIVIDTFEKRKQEVCNAIIYILINNENSGNTWMDLDVLSRGVLELLKKDGHPYLTGNVIKYFIYDNEGLFHISAYIKNKETHMRVAMVSTYNEEVTIGRVAVQAMKMNCLFTGYNPTPNNMLAQEQSDAVRDIILKGGHISILSGGPGTGKTTILRDVTRNMQEQFPGVKMHLLSTTGKAARVIQEHFGDMDVEVSTVHKFLGFGFPGGYVPAKVRQTIREAELVIVDEASMLDLYIFAKLMTSINIDKCKVILVGDVNQLPSVGAGNVLADLIAIGVHTSYLEENHRSQKTIVDNANKIKNGIWWSLKQDETFQIVTVPKNVLEYLAGHIYNNANTDIILSPYRTENQDGNTTVINKAFQAKEAEKNNREIYGDFVVGDRAIINHTNYAQGYFNGETGRILSYYSASGEYTVDLYDRVVKVKDAADIELGYAITAHKSQGSEYPLCDIIISEFNSFITRRLLYTAITRGAQKVRIWTTPNVLRQVIENNKEEERHTFMREVIL
jgi:exodeoxyribonuclease V alpha subunit